MSATHSHSHNLLYEPQDHIFNKVYSQPCEGVGDIISTEMHGTCPTANDPAIRCLRIKSEVVIDTLRC